MDQSAHLMQIQSAIGWTVATRTMTTRELRRVAYGLGRDPVQYALHSGRIGVPLS